MKSLRQFSRIIFEVALFYRSHCFQDYTVCKDIALEDLGESMPTEWRHATSSSKIAATAGSYANKKRD